jgi:hypothetical protein
MILETGLEWRRPDEHMIELSCTVLVPNHLKTKLQGRELLELFIKHFPNHSPTRFGDSEPLTGRFDANNLDAVLEAWGHFGFIAERRNPDVLLNVHFMVPSPKPKHSIIGLLRFQSETDEVLDSFEDFVLEVATVFEADYAAAHILTEHELADRLDILKTKPGSNVEYMKRRVQKEGFAKVLWGMTVLQHNSPKLMKCLPDLLWLTVFGRPYLTLFGRERLLSTPAQKVTALPNGAVVVKLTDHLDDNQASWETFKAVRDCCKAHLGHTAFCASSADVDQGRKAPQFRFPIELYEPRTSDRNQ